MARKAKRSRARTAQLRQRRVARRRHRQQLSEAPAKLRPIGNAKQPEPQQRRRKRLGAQQRRHDRRRRAGLVNRDPGAVYPNSPRAQIGFGLRPAGGEGQRHASGTKLFVGLVGPSRGQVMAADDRAQPKRRKGRNGSEKRRHKKGGRFRGPGGPGNRAAGKRPALEVFDPSWRSLRDES